MEHAPKEVGTTTTTTSTTESVTSPVPDQPPSKRPKLFETVVTINDADDSPMKDVAEKWVTIELKEGSSFVLSVLYKMVLVSGGFLNDNHMTAAQQLLVHQFPGTKGLHNTLYLAVSQTKDYK